MNTPGSPKISDLDFAVVYDISLPAPQIRVTNRSTGPDLSTCKWWFIVTTPSASEIHAGSLSVPDKTGVWSSWTMPEVWPQMFFHVEWSGAPYTVTLWVDDGVGNQYVLPYNLDLCPPPGNNGDVRFNFGAALIAPPEVKCGTAQVLVQDASNYLYKGNQGVTISLDWLLVYPTLPDGSKVPDAPISGTSYAYFPVVYNAKGYLAVLNTIRDYVIDANNTVRIKFKAQYSFDVACNIDMCSIICGYEKLLDKVEKGNCIDADLRNKLTLVNALVNMALIASTSTCAGVDLSETIARIKKELGDCDCGCDENGGITAQG